MSNPENNNKNSDELNTRFIYVGIKRRDNLLESMFRDFYHHESVIVIPSMFPFSADAIDILGDASTRFFEKRWFQRIMYLFQRVFDPFRKINICKEKTFILFTNFSIRGVSIPYIRHLMKKNPNATLILLFLDQKDIYSASYALKMVKAVPDFISYTFDPNDSKTLGFTYTMNVYSKPSIPSLHQDNDLYFSFFGPGRLERVAKIGKKIRDYGGKTQILYVGDYPQGFPDELKSQVSLVKKRISYEQVVADAASANCLLEYVRDTQSGVTIRYYEALCLNKKLLTNNKNVVNLSFYDERYIKVFSNIEDIDPKWVCSHEKVDYHYDGRFSPLEFLKEVENNV